MTVKCPACAKECAPGAFCSWCAARLDGSATETAMLGAVPHLSSSSSVDEGRFLPGTVLAGRYRIAGLLGRGGMGEVFRATDLTLGQAVALKFLPEALSRDERALARFYNEVRTARQVTHPNVCRVYDIGQVEGVPYISMEFLDGEDLASLLRRIGRLPVDKALETARKLCAGLAAAHERGVLHRDLKPANVMIDNRGQVIIMDFGLAGLTEQTQADARSGTPAYMSPEQLAGTGVTVKSDIYALGLVLYELFTGKRAFEAASLIELMDLQQKAKPASLTSAVRDLDPAVERVVLRCLAPNPADRPASALAVAAALPGGDPLAEALAAGETPSPEIVAAAGEMEGLSVKIGAGWLAAVVAGLIGIALVGPRFDISAKVPLENPPEVLRNDARNLLRDLGYTQRPADTAGMFEFDDAYHDYLKHHAVEAAARWQNPAQGWPLTRFWYREGPRLLGPERSFHTTVAFDDPPLTMSGMSRLLLDPQGNLQLLEVVPPQVEAPAPPGMFDWSRLFHAAALDITRFQPTEPQWTPLANWDQRAAWTGQVAGNSVRVEAAAWRGRPVSFRIIGPWNKPERIQPETSYNVTERILIYSTLIAACIIGWVQFRAQKVDLHGARKIALIYFFCMAGSLFLYMHHSISEYEDDAFWRVVGLGIINAGVTWVFYIALEPWVRKRWPQTLISWSRFVVKGVRDPLVGRDVLYGVAIACVVSLLTLVGTRMYGYAGEPAFPSLDLLNGVRFLAGDMLEGFTNAVIGSLLFFFLLFLLRLLLRKQWLAIPAFVLVFAVVNMSGGSWTEAVYYAGLATVWAAVLLRFGLLTIVVTDAVSRTLSRLPHAPDMSVWYAGLATVPLLVVGALALYGFRHALASRQIFGKALE